MISAYRGHNEVVCMNKLIRLQRFLINYVFVFSKMCKKVEYLLANGAHPNDQANCQASALHYAAECGNLEICKILLDNGALISVKNEYGMTPVITAAERTKEFVVEMFCERDKLLTKDEVNMMIILTIDATE